MRARKAISPRHAVVRPDLTSLFSFSLFRKGWEMKRCNFFKRAVLLCLLAVAPVSTALSVAVPSVYPLEVRGQKAIGIGSSLLIMLAAHNGEQALVFMVVSRQDRSQHYSLYITPTRIACDCLGGEVSRDSAKVKVGYQGYYPFFQGKCTISTPRKTYTLLAADVGDVPGLRKSEAPSDINEFGDYYFGMQMVWATWAKRAVSDFPGAMREFNDMTRPLEERLAAQEATLAAQRAAERAAQSALDASNSERNKGNDAAAGGRLRDALQHYLAALQSLPEHPPADTDQS